MTRAELIERIDTALARGGDYMRYGDLCELAKLGKVQFWASADAAIGTEVLSSPRRRMLHAFMAAGTMPALLAMQDQVTDFARAEGCSEMVCHGRAAWGRIGAAYGWYPRAIQFVREVPS